MKAIREINAADAAAYMQKLGRDARAASAEAAKVTTADKNATLESVVRRLLNDEMDGHRIGNTPQQTWT